jgi:chromosome segregation ATPase
MVTVVKSTPYDQITSRADSELAALDKAQDEIRAKIAAIQAQASEIQTQASNRNAQNASLREEVKSLEDQHDVVELEHRLGQGTDLALALSARLKKIVGELQAKRREIADLEKGTFASEAEEAARLQLLQSDLAAHEKRLQEIGTKRAATQAARDQFFAAQGEAEAQQIKSRLAELHNLLDAAQEAEQSTRATLLRFSDEAKSRLASWPALQRQIKPLLLYEDATTRIMDLAIQLRALLIEQGKGADIHPDVLRAAGMWGSSLVGEIAMEPQNLWPAITHTGKPERLVEQRQRLEKLLHVYREVKR